MPAKSKKQQRLMGMVHAIQKGELPPSESPLAARLAKTMKPSDVEEFASTPLKGLPEKKGPPKNPRPKKNPDPERPMPNLNPLPPPPPPPPPRPTPPPPEAEAATAKPAKLKTPAPRQKKTPETITTVLEKLRTRRTK